MSASRICLLAAATVGGALMPTASCWAQAYGAKAVVEQNDLRWFEPIELDVDGQMPRRDAGYFGRYEKLNWAYTNERITVGDPGVVNPGEEVFRRNPDSITQSQVDRFAAALGEPPTTAGAVAPPNATELAQIAEFLNVEFQTDGGGNVVTVIIDTGQTIDVGGVDVPLVFESPVIVPGTGDNPPPPVLVKNGIENAAPQSTFAWGERYEFGYSDGEHGWKVGILDGPDLDQTHVYGAGPGSEYRSQNYDNSPTLNHPFAGSDLVDADQDGRLDNPLATLGDVFALGFGSVAVNFEAPEDYFVGFRDYLLNNFPNGGTVYGPIFSVTNYGGPDDTILDTDPDPAAGIADDLDGDGITFQIILADLDGDGEIEDDEIIGTFIDYGDLYAFDVFFEDVTVRNVTSMDGIELMQTHSLSTSHHLERGRNDSLELSYGVRYLELQDMFSWDGRGSIIGRTGATVEMDNQIIGPQIGLEWTRHDGPWDFFASGRFMFGYNRTDRSLNGTFGQGAIPGALNNSINARTTTTVTGDSLDEFSPLGELRIGARYRVSSAMSVSVGYTGKFIDNIERAVPAMRYSAPNFALQSGRRDLLINGWNAGVELRY